MDISRHYLLDSAYNTHQEQFLCRSLGIESGSLLDDLRISLFDDIFLLDDVRPMLLQLHFKLIYSFFQILLMMLVS